MVVTTKTKSLKTKHTETLSELERYKLLVDSVQDYAIFLMDEEGYIQTWNKGAIKNKGYLPEDIIGRHFSTFYSDEDRKAKKPEKELELAKKFGRAEDEDWRIRKDGSRFWASVVITALYDPNGNLVGFAKVTRDLTERKLYEDEMRKANVRLSTQQKELRLLNQAKDDFISLASHQLRTPATVVKQLLGLFVEGFETGLPEKSQKMIEKAYTSNERLIHIINSLLKVAQVDSGKMTLKLDSVNITKLISEIITDFQDDINDRKQTIEFKDSDKEIYIIADIANLRMAIENLISNASKYTYQNGTIIISIKKHKSDIVISIKDNGVGISKTDIDSIFTKFTRIQNDLSEEVGGTGLGLYWSNKVINLHNGRIGIDSELNEGSTFNITLPIGD